MSLPAVIQNALQSAGCVMVTMIAQTVTVAMKQLSIVEVRKDPPNR